MCEPRLANGRRNEDDNVCLLDFVYNVDFFGVDSIVKNMRDCGVIGPCVMYVNLMIVLFRVVSLGTNPFAV